MKLKSTRPLYLGGEVRPANTVFETAEIHGRQLLQSGYAEETGDGDAVVQLDDNGRNVEDMRYDVLDTEAVASPDQTAAQNVEAQQDAEQSAKKTTRKKSE